MIYRLQAEIAAARKRGEPLEIIGPQVAEIDKHVGGDFVQKKPNGAYFDRNGRPVSRRERRNRGR